MKELQVTVKKIMHWRGRTALTSSDTKFVAKYHSGTERQVDAPFSFM